MPPCDPIWLTPGSHTLLPDTLYGLPPGWSLRTGPLTDTLRLWYSEGVCTTDSLLILLPGSFVRLAGEDTLYFRRDSGGGGGPWGVIFEGRFCVYAFKQLCGPGDWYPGLPGPTLSDAWWLAVWNPVTGQTFGKRCICNTTNTYSCADVGDPFVGGPDWDACAPDTLVVCRSSGMLLALAPYLPERVAGCATWPRGCVRARFYYQPEGGTPQLLSSCVVGALASGSLPCTAADSTLHPCNGIAGISHDTTSGRPFFWLPSCPAPGYYWGEPFMGGVGNVGRGAVLRVIDTRVGWTAVPPATGCVGQTIQLCATIGGASYVQSYTWTVGGQSFTFSGPLGPGDTGVVCQTLSLSAPGPLSVALSVRYDSTKVWCVSSCCSGAPGCNPCFSVSHVIQVSGPTCALVATPETVCVGQPVFFTLQGGCIGTPQQAAFSPAVGSLPPFSVSLGGWSYTYSAPGVYQAGVYVQGEGGQATFCAVQVVVKPKPSLSLTGPTQMCWNSPFLVVCAPSAGPVYRTDPVYCAGGDGMWDSLVWSVSCGGRSPTYGVVGQTLTILDWGVGRGGCQVCVTAWRGGCSTTQCLWVEDNREGHGVELRGPRVTCVDTVGAAVYALFTAQGQVWTPPTGVTVVWQVPLGVSYTATANTLTIQSWGPLAGVGGTLQAILVGDGGCRDTLSVEVASCCTHPAGGPVYVHTTVSRILQADPGAFSCRTFAIHDTLWVDTSVVWTNCHGVMGPGAVILLNRPRVRLDLVSVEQPACGIGGTRLEPCGEPWKGIYEGHDAVAVILRGATEEGGRRWRPVWIVGADTGVWMERGGGIWAVYYGFFNRCGVALYKAGPRIADCEVGAAYFTWAQAPALGTPTAPTYTVYPQDRAAWSSVLPAPSLQRLEAKVGIWLRALPAQRYQPRERFSWRAPTEVYFRHLDYGVVSTGVPVRLIRGRWERIEEQRCWSVEPAPPDARVVTPPDKGVLQCPAPFRCPRGTGVCSESELDTLKEGQPGGRDSVWVLQARFDTVSYGVWVESSSKKGVWEDRHLRGVRVENSTFQRGRQGITLWGVGFTPVSWDVRVSLQQNSGARFTYGMYLLVGRVAGAIAANGWVAPAGGLAGIYVANRYSHTGRGELSISDNVIGGDYRWGVRVLQTAGPLYVLENTVTVPRRWGARGLSLEVVGTAGVILQDNRVTYAGGPPLSSNPCPDPWPVGIEVALPQVPTPVQVCGNTVQSLPRSFFFEGHVGNTEWRNNRSLFATQLDLLVKGDTMQVLKAGSPAPLCRGVNSSLPLSLQWARKRAQVLFFELPPFNIPPAQGGCDWQPSPPFVTSALRVCRCPVVRRGSAVAAVGPPDTSLVARVVRGGGPIAQLWGAFRTLVSDTGGAILSTDTLLPVFYQWAMGRPMGFLESSYQQWRWAGEPVPAIGATAGLDPAEEVAARTLPVVEKVTLGERLTEAERDTLIALALRCPSTGGPFVYMARMAVELLHGDLLYQEECGPEGPETRRWMPPSPKEEAGRQPVGEASASSGPPLRPYLRLFPNPADLTLTVEWGGGEGPGEIEVYDFVGRRITGWAGGATGQRRLLVADWPRGVYKVVYRTGSFLRTEGLLLK